MELHTSTNTFGGDASTRKCRQKVGLKRKRLTEAEVTRGWEVFEAISWRSLKENIGEALRLSSRHNIYAYDAYYLEAASRYGCPLFSLDSRMKEVGKMEKIPIMEV